MTAKPRRCERQRGDKLVNPLWLTTAPVWGTILTLIIVRMRELGQELSVSECDLFSPILDNLVGFGLNTLVVVMVRISCLTVIAV